MMLCHYVCGMCVFVCMCVCLCVFLYVLSIHASLCICSATSYLLLLVEWRTRVQFPGRLLQ